MLVGLMHNSTAAKEREKNALLTPSNKSVKVSFVTPGVGNMGKMVEDFFFFALYTFYFSNLY